MIAPAEVPDDNVPILKPPKNDIKHAARKRSIKTLNQLFMATISDEEVQLIARKLVGMALDGDLKAIELILERKLGKVTQPIDHRDTGGRVVLVLPDNGRIIDGGVTARR